MKEGGTSDGPSGAQEAPPAKEKGEGCTLGSCQAWGSISPSTDTEDITFTASGRIEPLVSVGGPSHPSDAEASSSVPVKEKFAQSNGASTF